MPYNLLLNDTLYRIYKKSKMKTPRDRSNIHLSKEEKDLARQVARAVTGADEVAVGIRYLLHSQVAKLPEQQAREAAR